MSKQNKTREELIRMRNFSLIIAKAVIKMAEKRGLIQPLGGDKSSPK
jgi:hypothetical protein